ncbi:nucleotide-diphospho-sugar transferase [Piptocephalis cylindrospora]|uniref:Translation initiation factor eIF2B subunit gamma n=1 Tax=Piptocephalis cylindrospora TaxID=1907219 RepID=A0A4V1IYJ5_9FUNG|nr:nucleotide-diphospho-sugar transferase [Piptocephalis cylindrospora]|eukprot:RKP14779.1 nucleotide-diphospho-sugar transferase [Piptocephalis cylindrospora]
MLFFDETKANSTSNRQPRIPEFQGVILAGQGNNLSVLPEHPSLLPKALLPVAGRPMVCYPIEWLEKAGVLDIIIVAHGPAGPRISHALKSAYTGAAEVKVISLDGPAMGTADALIQIRDKLKHDIVVVGCDLITDVNSTAFLDHHRVASPSLTALFYQPRWEAGTPPKDNPFASLVGVEGRTGRLVMASSPDEDEISLRTSLLWKYPCVDLYTQLQDAHAYVMQRWVLDFVADRPKIISLREDLLPLLAKAQYKRGMSKGLDVGKYIDESMTDVVMEGLKLSSTSESPVDETSTLQPSCMAYIARRAEDGLTYRANTLLTFTEVNRHLIREWAGERVSRNTELSVRTQIGLDSLVGDGSKVEERSSIKRSILGSGCILGKGCKVVNTILMDNVILDDNVKLDGCIVADGARIGEKTSLRDCLVGPNAVVPKETQEKNEEFEREGR